MEERADGAGMIGEKRQERLGRNDRRELALGEVAPLRLMAQAVADDDVMLVPFLERGREVRAEEAGTTGDDDHGSLL